MTWDIQTDKDAWKGIHCHANPLVYVHLRNGSKLHKQWLVTKFEKTETLL